jgi:hypothetical protein
VWIHDLLNLNPLSRLTLSYPVNFMITSSGFTKLAGIAVALTTTLVAVPRSQAAIISLNFEGIDNGSSTTNIDNFYNGGTSSAGTSGVNYGVTFSPNALGISLNTLTTAPSNTSRGGLGDPNSQLGGLFFLTGSQTFINFASGFDTGFSLVYTAITSSGSISVYDDVDGAGNLLATLNLPTTPSSCASSYNAAFCPFFPVGVSFAGTAKSIGFAGVANQIALDDVTFGSATPGAPGGSTDVPEPLTIVGTILGGAAALRMRKRLKATVKL